MSTSTPIKPGPQPIPHPYRPHRSSSSTPPTGSPMTGGNYNQAAPPAISVTATSPPGQQGYAEPCGSPTRRYHDRFNRPSIDQSAQAAASGFPAQTQGQYQSPYGGTSGANSQSRTPPNGQSPYQAHDTHGQVGGQQMARDHSEGPAEGKGVFGDDVQSNRGEKGKKGKKDNQDKGAIGADGMAKGPKIGKNEYAEGWTKEDEEAERAYVEGGMFNWKEMMNWRFWIRKKWWCTSPFRRRPDNDIEPL